MALTGEQIRDLITIHQRRTVNERDQWDRYLRWYRSQYWGVQKDVRYQTDEAPTSSDDSDVATETNYPYAFIDSMISSIIPPNPQVTVVERNKQLKEHAKYREALVNDSFKRNQLAPLLWRLGSFSAVCGRAFIKAVWRFAKQRAEYRVIDPRFIFFDLSAERWEDIRYLIEVTTLTREEFERRAKQPYDLSKPRGKKRYNADQAERALFGSYPSWLKPALKESRDISSEAFEWVTVYEVYDFTANRFYHWLDGEVDALFADDLPYRMLRNPFTMLAFNDNLQSLAGIPDIQIIDRQQQMLNELDTLELRHAQSSIPITLFHSGLTDNPSAFIKSLMEATSPGDAVAIHGKPGVGIGDIISHTPTTALSPSFAVMRERLTKSIEFALGLPQYARGVVGQADVATEVALADMAVRTRNGRRLQAVQHVISWLASATVGLYEEFLSRDSVLPIRLTGRRESLMVTRAAMGARDPSEIQPGMSVEAPLEYDYDVVPYSPTENSRTIQLKNLAQMLELLLSSEDVDKRRLVEKVVDLLNLDPDLLVSEEEKQKAMQEQMAAAQAEQGAAGPALAGANGGGAPMPNIGKDIATPLGGSTEGVAPAGPRVSVPGPASGGPGFPTNR